MDEVKGVYGFKRGNNGLYVSNKHFDIMLYFKDSEDGFESQYDPIKLLDTQSNVKASLQVKLINEFMDVHKDIIYPH